MSQSINTTIGLAANATSTGQHVEWEGPFVSGVALTNNSGISIQYTLDGATWTTVASGATANPTVSAPAAFRLRKTTADSYPVPVGLSWTATDNFIDPANVAFTGGVIGGRSIGQAQVSPLKFDPTLTEVAAVPGGLTTVVGPSVITSDATEYATLSSALPKAYTFDEASNGTVNANKYLGNAGHAVFSNPETHGVWIFGTWQQQNSSYYQFGFAEFITDAPDFAIVLRTQYGMTGDIAVDGVPVTADSINSAGDGSLRYQWVRATYNTTQQRRVSFSLQNVKEIRVGAGYSIWKPPAQPTRLKIFGDSLTANYAGNGETLVHSGAVWLTVLSSRVCRILGLPLPAFSSRGGTGFLATTASDGNYLQRMQNEPASNEIGIVWLWGSTNDYGQTQTAYQAQVKAVIDLALTKYPNARVIVTGTLDGFVLNGASNSATYSGWLQSVCAGYGSTRVSFIPVGASQRTDQGYLYGTGKVGATTGDGNADIYCGTATSGTDRHWGLAGIRYAALRYAYDIKAALEAI